MQSSSTTTQAPKEVSPADLAKMRQDYFSEALNESDLIKDENGNDDPTALF